MTASQKMLGALQEEFPKLMTAMWENNQLVLEEIALKTDKLEQEQRDKFAIKFGEWLCEKADVAYIKGTMHRTLQAFKNEQYIPTSGSPKNTANVIQLKSKEDFKKCRATVKDKSTLSWGMYMWDWFQEETCYYPEQDCFISLTRAKEMGLSVEPFNDEKLK